LIRKGISQFMIRVKFTTSIDKISLEKEVIEQRGKCLKKKS